MAKKPIQTETSTTPRRSRKQAIIWTTMTKARNLFGHQLIDTQNLETKIACIKQAALLTYTDQPRVWLDMQTEANALTNLKDFNARCNVLGLTPEDVAGHLIFEGKTVVQKVKNDGLDSAIGERVQMFTAPLFTQVTAPTGTAPTSTAATGTAAEE